MLVSTSAGDQLTLETGGITSNAAGAVVSLKHDESTEEIEAREGGFEQRWIFPRRPRGAAIRMSLPVHGVRLERSSPAELSFRGARGSLVRYGDAAWVDATGQRFPVAVAWTGSEIVLEVAQETLDRSRYPAVLDPTLSVELPLVPPGPSTNQLVAMRQVIGTDGTNFASVWNTDPGGLFVSFITPQGGVSPRGAYLGASAWADRGFAYGAGEYLVAWLEAERVFVRRFASDGTLLDSTPIDVGPGVANGNSVRTVAVAFGAGAFLVVFADDSGAVSAARVSPAGQLLDSTPTSIGTNGRRVAAVGNSTGFLVTWGGASTSTTVLLDASAQPASSSLSTASDTPFLATDGTHFLVVWEELPAGASQWVVMSSLFDGTFHPGVLLSASGAGPTGLAQVGFDGTDYVVVWPSNGSFFGRRVDVTGNAKGSAPSQITPAPPSDFGFACANGVCLLGYPAPGGYGSLARLSSGFTVLDNPALLLGDTPNAQTGPDVVSNGDTFFVAWTEPSAGCIFVCPAGAAVVGARVGPDGGVLDPQGLVLAPSRPAFGTSTDVALASNASDFLAVWNTSGTIEAARVASDGGLLDSPPIQLGAGVTDSPPSAAANGTEYLVSFQTPSGIVGARLAFDGGLLDQQPIAIASDLSKPSVSSDGTQFIVVWMSPTSGLVGTRVDQAGALVDAQPVQILNEPGYGVTFDGMNWFVKGTAHAARVSPAAVVLDQPPLVFGSFARSPHPVTFDGFQYLEPVVTGDQSLQHQLLQVQRLSADGGAIATITFDDLGSGQFMQPAGHAAAASNRLHTSLFAYERTNYQEPYWPKSTFIRLYDSGPGGLGLICAIDDDCSSGHCVDGVCCDGTCGGGVVDCLACSRAKGATADGTCQLLPAAAVCRPGLGGCDPDERCDGVNVACPADEVLDAGVVCRPANGQCDVAELCDGSRDCPPNLSQPSGTTCDDGNDCSTASACNGLDCIATASAGNGAVCDDHDACSISSSCSNGACVAGVAMTCEPPDECHLGSCDPASGSCVFAPLDGVACDGGTCILGACTSQNDGGADGGSLDGGRQGVDGGSNVSPPRNGCGCNAGSGLGAIAIFALVRILRRRR